MGTHLRVLNESFQMNTNMTGFRWFSSIFVSCALDESSLTIQRVILCYFKVDTDHWPVYDNEDV